jgi:predicted metal-dependent phosphoesterase TrpH
MGLVDLHIHTTASDGKLSPAEIVRKAAGLGLRYIAISDHDTVDGIAPALEAALAFPELTVIPAVELSTEVSEGEIHVLGYFIDYQDAGFITTLDGLRHSRRERGRKMVTRLGELDLDISWDRVQEIAGDASIGRPHVAQALLEKGYITDMREAFDLYLGKGKPAYVEREKITPSQAVQIIIKAKGLPVLAHPYTAGRDPKLVVGELKAAGLMGVEAYYGEYNETEINRLVALANNAGLVATGGSDYHGEGTTVAVGLGEAPVPLAAAERLLAMTRQYSRRRS